MKFKYDLHISNPRQSRASLVLFTSDGEVTIYWAVRYAPGNCNASTRKVTSISFDIKFIYGDIHDRTTKKLGLVI